MENKRTKCLKKNPSFAYLQLLMLALIHPYYKEYQKQILEQLRDTNERYIIYTYLNFINSPELADELDKPILEYYFFNSAIVHHYEKLKNGYSFETKHGKLTAYKLDSVLKNSLIATIINEWDVARQSYQIVKEYSLLDSDGFAITSEIDSLFGDPLYWSFLNKEIMY